MAVRVNQKSWRLKKDFSLIQTNIININFLFFFLRKFLGVFLSYYSLFFLEVDTFFFKKKLILNIFVFERQRLLKTKYKIKKKYMRNEKKNKVKLVYKKNKRRLKIILLLRKRQLKLFMLKIKLNTLLKTYLHQVPIQINIISLNKIYLKNKFLLKLKHLLTKKFSFFISQKRYKYFCAKWFYLLPIASFYNYSNLFSLCIKDGLERTGRQHSQFLRFFKMLIKFLLLYGFGLGGLRVQIVGKLDGNDRVQRSLISFGKFPSRTTLNLPIQYSALTAYTYTGTFGIKILHLFNKKL